MRILFLLPLFFACGGQPDQPTGPDLLQTAESITISIAGKPVLEYVITPCYVPEGMKTDSLAARYARSGFIHPVYSPNGQIVTDDFPAGYAHQHAVFTAWTKTTFRGEFHDFWNQHKGLATVAHQEVVETIDSDAVAGFTARLRHLSLEHGAVLDEIWRVRVHNETDVYVWDLHSEQTNVTDDTLFLEKHPYGGLGVRGSAEWNARDSVNFYSPAKFLTSAGMTRENGNHSRPEWVSMYGDFSTEDGSDGTAGITVIPHPDNFRSPQFVRLHPDLPYFSVTPVVEEGFYIAPGEKYVARWRFVVGDGELGSHSGAGVSRRWAD